MIDFVVHREGLDDHIIADAGVLINNRALYLAVTPDPERCAVRLAAVPVSAHNDRIPDFRAAPDDTAQPDQRMFEDCVLYRAAFRQEYVLAGCPGHP